MKETGHFWWLTTPNISKYQCIQPVSMSSLNDKINLPSTHGGWTDFIDTEPELNTSNKHDTHLSTDQHCHTVAIRFV